MVTLCYHDIMSRKKSADRTIWQHKFNLSSDNPDDVRLHEHLVILAADEKSMEWIRNSLTSLLPSKLNHSNTVLPPKRHSLEDNGDIDFVEPITYEPIDD